MASRLHVSVKEAKLILDNQVNANVQAKMMANKQKAE